MTIWFIAVNSETNIVQQNIVTNLPLTGFGVWGDLKINKKNLHRPPISADLEPLLHCVFLFGCDGNAVTCAQICHTIQDQLWKLEVRRLLQWASNGRIMQLRSSGCPHYLAVVVINGLKCMLSKSQEKCDPSSKIQMVPLQRCSRGSLCILFIM